MRALEPNLPSLPQLLEPLNTIAEPLIRAGFANPWLFAPGATVLEVRGRKTGIIRSVPLTCYLAGFTMIVGTVRSRSQWIRNLAAAGSGHVWLWGRHVPVTVERTTDNVAVLRLQQPER